MGESTRLGHVESKQYLGVRTVLTNGDISSFWIVIPFATVWRASSGVITRRISKHPHLTKLTAAVLAVGGKSATCSTTSCSSRPSFERTSSEKIGAGKWTAFG